MTFDSSAGTVKTHRAFGVVVGLVLGVGVLLSGAGPVSAQLGATVQGTSCVTWDSNPSTANYAGADGWTFIYRCFLNSTTTGMDSKLLTMGNAPKSGTAASQYLYYAYNATGGPVSSQCAGTRTWTVFHGQFTSSTGADLGAPTNASLPDNYVNLTLNCSVGSNGGSRGTRTAYSGVDAGGLSGFEVLLNSYWGVPCVQGTDTNGRAQDCYIWSSNQQIARTWYSPGNGMSRWDFDEILPEGFTEGQLPIVDPCDEITYKLRVDGVPLTPPLSGQVVSTSALIELDIELPDLQSGTVSISMAAAAGAPLTGLGSWVLPQQYRRKRANVSPLFDALDTFEVDLKDVKVQCQSGEGVSHWTGESTTGSPGGQDPFQDAIDSEGAEGCFSQTGMTLTNPASWVRGLGRMGLCVVGLLFVPSSSDLDERLVRFEALRAEPPLQWADEGAAYVGDASFSFATWSSAGPDCVTILDSQQCPRDWDNPGAVPGWVAGAFLFGAWLVVVYGVFRFF